MSSQQEKMILTRCGYDIDHIFSSSQCNASKGNKGLYKYVVNYFNCEKGDLLHIGDNYKSDFIAAKEAGIDAFHYYEEQNTYHKEPREIWRFFYNNLNGLFMSKHVRQSVQYAFLRNRSNQFSTDLERIGYDVLGPVAFSFCREIHRYVEENNINMILFAARDMYYIMKAYEMMYQEEKNFRYFRMSRMAIAPFEDYLRTTGQRDINIESSIGLKKYLLKVIGNSTNALFVDLGWTGKTYRILESFITKEIKGKFILHYGVFGIKDTKAKFVNRNSFKGFYLFKGQANDIHTYVNTSFIETIFSAEEASCCGYEENGTPILNDYCGKKELSAMKAGMLRYVKDAMDVKYLQSDVEGAICALLRFCENPFKSDIDYLKDYHREDDSVISTISKKPIISYPFRLFTEISNSTWKGGHINTYFPKCGFLVRKVYLIMICIKRIVMKCFYSSECM